MRWGFAVTPAAKRPRPGGTAAWYAASQAEQYGFSPDEAAAVVSAVEERYLGEAASAAARARFRKKLHLEELMLARACSQGRESAWEAFFRRYHARMRAAARALTRETQQAHELADGLFAELFGLRLREGTRVSKLDAYTGLGSLEGWLRALLAQAHVDQWRRDRRWLRLDASEDFLSQLAAPPTAAPPRPAARAHLEAALETVLASAGGHDRLLLSLYFLDEMTLAQIGGLLRVHESTVSRRLDRVLTRLRRETRRELARRGLGAGAREEVLGLDPKWLSVDVRKCLQATPPSPPSPHAW